MLSSKDNSANTLLEELQALDEMLGADLANIPILDEPINGRQIPAEEKVAPKKAENPFLSEDVLQRLTRERMAAQFSVEEANRTMQAVQEKKQIEARNILAEIGRTLDQEQKDTLINQMVDEMLPQIAERLKVKLKVMLAR